MIQGIPNAAKTVPNQQFATTQWEWINRAKHQEFPEAASACEHLCKAYWPPLYQFILRNGYSPENAEDLTQGFVLMLLEKNFWERADRSKGRFRNLLLKALTQFLADQREKANALKRGRGVRMLSIEREEGTSAAAELAGEGRTPEELFNRSWAISLMEQARARLRRECIDSGRAKLYDYLGLLPEHPPGAMPYAEIARELGVSVSAIKSAVSRMRVRFGQLVREEVARTVTAQDEVDEEIRFLLSVISS